MGINVAIICPWIHKCPNCGHVFAVPFHTMKKSAEMTMCQHTRFHNSHYNQGNIGPKMFSQNWKVSHEFDDTQQISELDRVSGGVNNNSSYGRVSV